MRKRQLRIRRSLKRLGMGSWARSQKVKHMARGAAVSQRKFRNRW